jgi:hypothetical protein
MPAIVIKLEWRIELPRLAIALSGVAVGLVALAPLPAQSQDWTQREFPLAPPNANGNFVAPFFDGWYPNEDGTYTLSFGFMNRNDTDLVEIQLGTDNFIEPAEFDGDQPESFPVVRYGGFGGPRERGVFGVVVPADFEGDVWWTLTTDGYTTRVPGRLKSPGLIITGAYELSTTPMARGSLRPIVRFSEDGPDIIGIEGVESPEVRTTTVGEPIEVEFWAFDRGERDLQDVNMTLWKHQGPVDGNIAFESLVEVPPAPEGAAPGRGRGGGGFGGFGGGFGRSRRPPGPGPVDVGVSIRLPIEGPDANMGSFSATFDTPGEYLIRIRIDNFTSRDSAAGNQCCWSNGYIRVRVTE